MVYAEVKKVGPVGGQRQGSQKSHRGWILSVLRVYLPTFSDELGVSIRERKKGRKSGFEGCLYKQLRHGRVPGN